MKRIIVLIEGKEERGRDSIQGDLIPAHII